MYNLFKYFSAKQTSKESYEIFAYAQISCN